MVERGTNGEIRMNSSNAMTLPARRRLPVALTALALFAGFLLYLGVDSANAKSTIFQYASFPTGPQATQAGGHPDVETEWVLGNRVSQPPIDPCGCDDPKDIIVEAPTGVVGNPHVLSICTAAEIALYECAPDSQVGFIQFIVLGNYAITPIYRTVPLAGQAALFVFVVPLGMAIPEYIAVNARTESDYGLNFETIGINHFVPGESNKLVYWGVPGSHANDYMRFKPGESGIYCGTQDSWEIVAGEHRVPEGCFAMNGGGYTTGAKLPVESSLPIKPFIENPTRCTGPLSSTLETHAYDNGVDRKTQPWPAISGCDQLGFDPSLSANPTTEATDTASGVDISLAAPQLQTPTTPSASEIRASTVTFPPGFSINPGSVDGKVFCTDAEARFGTREPAQCPEHAKIGTLSIDSSALPGPIDGAVYLGESKPGERYRILLTAYGFGTAVKIAGTVHADPQSGQLVASFVDLPEAPFQEFDLHLFGSERGILATPTQCGEYPVHSSFVPWDESLSSQTSTQFFRLAVGPDGSPCPDGARPFNPSWEGGSEDNTAGKHAPFTLRLKRPDGDQELSATEVSAPPGLSATLKGIPYCPQATIDHLADEGHTGLAELASPACPAASQVGSLVTGAGAGSRPLFTGGRVFLAGPYKGAPLSLVFVVPAVAGPYDLGNVIVRVALEVDETTAQITAVSDPLPRIVGGIPVRLRSVLIRLDRTGFVLNPTNCDPFSVRATATGSEGATSTTSLPFQVANCADLDFSPKLALELNGSPHRRAHPAVRAVLTQGAGAANIARTVVTLPPTELIDNAHIRTICTRVQFAADNCPAGSVIGRVKAFTPLLDQPLEGNVYLRSTGTGAGAGALPDLVADLRGQVRIVFVGHIDSVHGAMRTIFDSLPDAPVSRVVLSLQGGNKGLLQNGEGVCARGSKARVTYVAQNGARTSTGIPLQSDCRSHSHHRRHGRHRRRSQVARPRSVR